MGPSHNLTPAPSPFHAQALRTFRVLRILRSLRLLARVEGLRRLMKLVIKVGLSGGG